MINGNDDVSLGSHGKCLVRVQVRRSTETVGVRHEGQSLLAVQGFGIRFGSHANQFPVVEHKGELVQWGWCRGLHANVQILVVRVGPQIREAFLGSVQSRVQDFDRHVSIVVVQTGVVVVCVGIMVGIDRVETDRHVKFHDSYPVRSIDGRKLHGGKGQTQKKGQQQQEGADNADNYREPLDLGVECKEVPKTLQHNQRNHGKCEHPSASQTRRKQGHRHNSGQRTLPNDTTGFRKDGIPQSKDGYCIQDITRDDWNESSCQKVHHEAPLSFGTNSDEVFLVRRH